MWNYVLVFKQVEEWPRRSAALQSFGIESWPRRKELRREGGEEHPFLCLMTNRKRCDAAGFRARTGLFLIPTPQHPSPVAPEGVRPALS